MGGVINFIGGLFGAKSSATNSNVTVTGRDLVPSTESDGPESAVLGSSGSYATTMNGKESLKIQANSATTTKKKSYSGIYNNER